MVAININKNSPHQAVISINYEIMERLETGQVTGLPVKRGSKVFTVIGKNFEECSNNLNKFMEKLNVKQ